MSELLEAMERASTEPSDLRPLLRDAVGKRPLSQVEAEVRETMLDEALSRTGGTRSGAARLLEVSRQLVQHMQKNRR